MQNLKYNHWWLGVISGVLLAISWPPISFSLLIFIAFVPLLYGIEKSGSLRKALYSSYIAIFIWWSSVLYWILNVNADVSDYIFIGSAFIIAPLVYSVPILITYFLRLKSGRILAWFFLPLFWSAYEYLLANWDLAYNWINLGLSIADFPGLIGIYSLIGTIGGGFLILFVNIFLFFIVINWSDLRKRISLGVGFIGLLSLLILLSFLVNSGSHLRSESVKVAVVQPNYDPYKELSDVSVDEQIAILEEFTDDFQSSSVDLIVLPEGYLNGGDANKIILNRLDSLYAIKRLKALAQKVDAGILTGFIGYRLYRNQSEASESAIRVPNSGFVDAYTGALLITPEARTQVYTKYKLVPFMERVPFLKIFSGLEQFRFNLNQSENSYAKVEHQQLLRYKNMNIIPVICIETVFPDYLRQFLGQGGNLLAIISNEGWAGKTSGYRQNAAYAAPLAVQLGKSVVRSANTGISMFMTKEGKIEQSLGWGERGVLIQEVELIKRKTFYSQYGDFVGRIAMYLGFISLLFLGAKEFITRRRAVS